MIPKKHRDINLHVGEMKATLSAAIAQENYHSKMRHYATNFATA
jgi:hypothetical protein